METQANDTLCQNLKGLLKKDELIPVNEDGLFCRKAPADGAIQIIVPGRYKRALLYHGHCPPLVGHPGTGKMYDVLRRRY